MATRPSRAEHEAAVARRLEQLTAELAGVRDQPVADPDPGSPEIEAELSPVVPSPGRHAARRGIGAAGLVPEPLRGRVALGAPQLAVVAVLVALGLGVTAWWVVRSQPAQVTPVAPVPAATSPSGLTSPSAPVGAGEPTGGGSSVTVDVAGKVRRPGIAVLDAGSRVVDALEAAGGARAGVALSSLNLARPLVDGEQILVGVATPAVAAPSASAAPGAAGALVNINLAGAEELESLPEVGPVTAQAIIGWREDNGGFTAVEELMEVDGIGEATLEAMAPFVTI